MKRKGILFNGCMCSCLGILLLGIMFILVLPAQAESNWWDKFGKPQYGGKAAIAI